MRNTTALLPSTLCTGCGGRLSAREGRTSETGLCSDCYGSMLTDSAQADAEDLAAARIGNDPRSAHQIYAGAALAKLELLTRALEARRDEADGAAAIHWGHVGDIAHADELLGELVASFLAGGAR